MKKNAELNYKDSAAPRHFTARTCQGFEKGADRFFIPELCWRDSNTNRELKSLMTCNQAMKNSFNVHVDM